MGYRAFTEIAGKNCHPIRPNDINATRPIGDTFGNTETEMSAAAVVRYCQHKGAWTSFTQKEINEFLGGSFHPNDLVKRVVSTRDDGRLVTVHAYLYQDGDLFTVTHEFICRCYAGAPREETLLVGARKAA